MATHWTLWTLALLIMKMMVHAERYAPNHFLGTCLTTEWVREVEATLGISSLSRDALGRTLHPHLHAALQTPRYQIPDARTSHPSAYGTCMQELIGSTVMYGAGATVDNDGNLINLGNVANTFVIELSDWNTHSLTTMVFAILAAEIYGYQVSFLYATNTTVMTQRMSSVHSGICAPSHVNLEVWTAGIEANLRTYANESFPAGAIGYSGRSGLYTTTEFIKKGRRNGSRAVYYADFWPEYVENEQLISHLNVTKLWNNTKYYPPTTPDALSACADDSGYGCRQGCAKSFACTQREKNKKKCMVVIMMYDYYDPGYLQAVLSNLDFPAYFCFLGYDGAQSYVMEAEAAHQPVLFYHFEPDVFHFNHPNKFDRVFLPRATPERVLAATGSYGELGYGQKTTNPIDVDFPVTTLQKYAASLLQNHQPAGQFVSRFSLTDLHINDLLRKYLDSAANSSVKDAYFDAACTWVRENYGVWNLWLDRLPLCSFENHIQYEIQGCTDDSPNRTIVFQWRHPDPMNALSPYDCDGGLQSLPAPLVTSRSCEWLRQDQRRWVDWMANKPACDASFYGYSISECDANAKRRVEFHWLLPNPMDPMKPLECTGGAALPSNVRIDCDYMPFISPGFVIVGILAAILAILLVVSMVFVYRNRKVSIIKRSQYELLLLMLVGGILMCLASVAYAGAPTPFLCGARPVLISMGFTGIFGALLLKSLRVYRVFMRTTMKRKTLTTKMMFKIFLLLWIVDWVILIVWFVTDFPWPRTKFTDALEFQGQVDHTSCSSTTFIYSALLLFWKAMVLIIGLYVSFLIRNVSTDFQESIWIFGATWVVLLASGVLLPLVYLVQLAAAALYLFLASFLLLCTAIIMAFMMVPKFYRFRSIISSRSSNSSESKYSTSPHNQRVGMYLVRSNDLQQSPPRPRAPPSQSINPVAEDDEQDQDGAVQSMDVSESNRE